MRIAVAMCSVFVLGVLGVGCAAQVDAPEEGVESSSAAMALPPPPPPVEETNCDEEDSASDRAEANKQRRDEKQSDKGNKRVCKNKDKGHG